MAVARPLRFRRAPGRWTPGRVDTEIRQPLDNNLGASAGQPWFASPDGYQARRFDMDDGSMALFCWTNHEDNPPSGTDPGPVGYWLGNTETPRALWNTDKYGFGEVSYGIQRWSERELLAALRESAPWLEPYEHLAWFFLPVFCSKDGAETTRRFFKDHAAGLPDTDHESVLKFYDSLLRPGILDDYRETMASKLGTSQTMDLVRMSATMAEFHAAKLLTDAGYAITPEIGVSTGHSLDFRADDSQNGHLIEVTRPQPVQNRAAGTPVAAVRDTAATKVDGQLAAHGGGAVLFVDCSSFPDDDWRSVAGERPDVRHRPTVVFRTRPTGRVEAYEKGAVPVSVDDAVTWVDR
ncbi:MAG: hypothetical protein A07HR60_01103 [uncultured archaeon A07HR60]|nr:MAG: hypothetical protein A07HR60_01103 [uncultured archaeon A07HR60]